MAHPPTAHSSRAASLPTANQDGEVLSQTNRKSVTAFVQRYWFEWSRELVALS